MKKTILVCLSLITVFLFLAAGCKTVEEQGEASEEAIIGEAVKMDSGYILCAQKCKKGATSYKNCISTCTTNRKIGTTETSSNEFPALKPEVAALDGVKYDLAAGESFTLPVLDYKVTLSSITGSGNNKICNSIWEFPLWTTKPSGNDLGVIICTPVMIVVKNFPILDPNKCRYEIDVDSKINNPYEWAMLPYFNDAGQLVNPTSLADSFNAQKCKAIWDKIIKS